MHTCEIFLTDGSIALVDEADLSLVADHRWFPRQNNRNIYAMAKINGKAMFMHRLLLPNAQEIDHANRNGLDNRRANLRPCTHAQNMANRRVQRNNASGVAGVSWSEHHKKWSAYVSRNRKTILVGRFEQFVDACQARANAATVNYGEFSA